MYYEKCAKAGNQTRLVPFFFFFFLWLLLIDWLAKRTVSMDLIHDLQFSSVQSEDWMDGRNQLVWLFLRPIVYSEQLLD